MNKFNRIFIAVFILGLLFFFKYIDKDIGYTKDQLITIESRLSKLEATMEDITSSCVTSDELLQVQYDIVEYRQVMDDMVLRYKGLDEVLDAWFGDQQKAVMRSYERSKK